MKTNLFILLLGLGWLSSCDENKTPVSDTKAGSGEQDTTVQNELDPRIAVAREYVLNEIIKSKPLELTEFKKTNSYEMEERGISLYVIEWETQAIIRQDVVIDALSTTGKNNLISRDRLSVYAKGDQVFDDWESKPVSIWRKHYRKLYTGAVIRLTGECKLQKTENGWRVADFRGGEFKTSEILSEVN